MYVDTVALPKPHQFGEDTHVAETAHALGPLRDIVTVPMLVRFFCMRVNVQTLTRTEARDEYEHAKALKGRSACECAFARPSI